MKQEVLIYRNEVLPRTETFILAQALAMRSFEPHFTGVHPSWHSLQLPDKPDLVVPSTSRLSLARARLFWKTGYSSGFYQRLRRRNAALVHAHFGVDGAAALYIRDQLRIPLVVTLHGYDVTRSDHFLLSKPEGRCYLARRQKLWSEASQFICISDFIRTCALKAGFPEDKLRVVYTGIDLELFRPSDAGNREGNLIAFVGRLVEKKGCIHLLKAIKYLNEQRRDVRAVVLGDGPLRRELQDYSSLHSLPCEFLGTQPAQTVYDYLKRARLLCVPSLTASDGDSEGLGMVFLEAQAVGTPVVSFSHGGIIEAVRDGVTGILVPEGDSLALGEAIGHYLKDNGAWRRSSEAGIDWIKENFDIRKQTAALEALYSKFA